MAVLAQNNTTTFKVKALLYQRIYIFCYKYMLNDAPKYTYWFESNDKKASSLLVSKQE